MKRHEEQFKKLTAVGSVSRGKSKHRPRNDPALYGGDYPFVQTGDVKHANFYITEFSQTYNERGLAQSKLWPAGTLCITIAANIADTAVLGIPACFPDSIIGFTPRERESDVRFIKYCLDTYKREMRLISQGTTQDNLSQEKLLSLRFRIPDYATQRKIAAVLAGYDDLIEANRRRIALLERMAEELYREWFVRLRFPGHTQTKITKGLPAGWIPKPSNELFNLMSGGTPDTDNPVYWDGGIPFFTPKDASENCYVLGAEKTLTDKGLESCNSPLFPKDTLFITARGTVGKLAIARRPMAMNQSCYALSPKMPGPVFWHYLALRTAIVYVKGVAQSGVFDNIVLDTFKVVPIFWPGETLVQEFNKIAVPIFEQVGVLLESNAALQRTRDLLLPRLISGKLPVEDLPIAFPPSMAEK